MTEARVAKNREYFTSTVFTNPDLQKKQQPRNSNTFRSDAFNTDNQTQNVTKQYALLRKENFKPKPL